MSPFGVFGELHVTTSESEVAARRDTAPTPLGTSVYM